MWAVVSAPVDGTFGFFACSCPYHLGTRSRERSIQMYHQPPPSLRSSSHVGTPGSCLATSLRCLATSLRRARNSSPSAYSAPISMWNRGPTGRHVCGSRTMAGGRPTSVTCNRAPNRVWTCRSELRRISSICGARRCVARPEYSSAPVALCR